MSRGQWMETISGQRFYPTAPRVGDITTFDVAHSLSLLCRYGGHIARFYSVAEHCVLMSRAVSPGNALWALLHDATEAYLGDMVRPLKLHMPEYRAVEDRLAAVIAEQFGLDPVCPDEVKEADSRIIHDERRVLARPGHGVFPSIAHLEPLGVHIAAWSPFEARRRFMGRLMELGVFA